jgi:hypothetical protein
MFDILKKITARKNRSNQMAESNEEIQSFNDYVLAEVVAIPEDFKLENHLKMRERMGIFKSSMVNIKHLNLISESVKYSPFFIVLNNQNISIHSCMYYLHIVNELGLVLKSVDNPIRKSTTYENYVSRLKQDDFQILRGIEFKRIHFIIVNVVPLLQQNVIQEASQAIANIQQYQKEIEKELLK